MTTRLRHYNRPGSMEPVGCLGCLGWIAVLLGVLLLGVLMGVTL